MIDIDQCPVCHTRAKFLCPKCGTEWSLNGGTKTSAFSYKSPMSKALDKVKEAKK